MSGESDQPEDSTEDDGRKGDGQQGGDEAQGEGGHKDLSEHPTAAGALWTRSEHPLIRKALAMLGIKPESGLILDTTDEKVNKLIRELEKKRKNWAMINDKGLHRNQLFLLIDNTGRIFVEPTATLATGVKPDNSWLEDNPRLSYIRNKAGDYHLITSNIDKWVEYDPLSVGGQEALGHAAQLIHVPEEMHEHYNASKQMQDVPEVRDVTQEKPDMSASSTTANSANKAGTWYLRSEYKPVEFVSGGMPFDLQTFMIEYGLDNPIVKYMAGFYLESHIPVPELPQVHKDSQYLLMPMIASSPEPQYPPIVEDNEPPVLYYVEEMQSAIPVKKKTYFDTPAKSSFVEKVAPPIQPVDEIVKEIIKEQPSAPELEPAIIKIPVPLPKPLVTVEHQEELEESKPNEETIDLKVPKVESEVPAAEAHVQDRVDEEVLSQAPDSKPHVIDEKHIVLMDVEQVSAAYKKARANAFNGFYSGIETRKLLADLRTKYGAENIQGGESIPDDPESPLVLTIREGKYQHVVAELTISRAFTRDQGKKVAKGDKLVDKYIVKLDPKDSPDQTPAQKQNQTEAIDRIYELGEKSRSGMLQGTKKSAKSKRSVM